MVRSLGSRVSAFSGAGRRGSEKEAKMRFVGLEAVPGCRLGEGRSRRSAVKVSVLLIWALSVMSGSQGLSGGRGSGSRLLGAAGEEFRKLEKNGKSHHVSRRIASIMVPVREREMSSLCTYEVTTDVNLQRIPDKIDRVLCRKDSCKCVEQGDYRCTQLYTQLNVTYLTGECKSNFEFELIDVEYACVCSKVVEGSNVNLLEPVLV